MIIRSDQLKTFEEVAHRQFEDEMVAHSKEFAPKLCEVNGDDQVRVAVRSAIARSGNYGFTNRGPIRLFIELSFLWGSFFDTDPQYLAVSSVLRGSSGQMLRADELYVGYLDYLDRVSGPGAANVHQALRDLLTFAKQPAQNAGDFEAYMLHQMSRIFPQKAAYAGQPALQALIAEGVAEGREHRFNSQRELMLLVVLKFAFGHGCMADPLYPWIERTLSDSRITDPAARAARLERKAVTWLEHVVARNEQREKT